jgi:hypothetical protein
MRGVRHEQATDALAPDERDRLAHGGAGFDRDGRLGDRVPGQRERMVALDPRQQTTRRHPPERGSGLAPAHDDRVHAMPAHRRKHVAKRRVLDEAQDPGAHELANGGIEVIATEVCRWGSGGDGVRHGAPTRFGPTSTSTSTSTAPVARWLGAPMASSGSRAPR